MTLQGQRQTWAIRPYPLPGGEGGQAFVYATRDGRFAVKLAKEGMERFLERERESLERLHAEHEDLEGWVVRVVDAGISPEGRPFLVLPYFPATLGSWTRGRAIEDRLLAMERACEAVVRLHWTHREMDYEFDDGRRTRGRVVHRDIRHSTR